MGAALESIRAKIKRAEHHIHDFEIGKREFFRDYPQVVVPKFNAELNLTLYVLHSSPPVPEWLRVVAGDAIHNLRSALDYLACALVDANGKRIRTATGFPILDPASEKCKATFKGRIRGMRKEAIQIIERYEPYKGRNRTLWGIHQLDIVDKHRLLVAIVAGVKHMGIMVTAEMVESAFEGMPRSDLAGFTQGTFQAPPVKAMTGAKQGSVILSIKGRHDEKVDFAFDVMLCEADIVERQPILKFMLEAKDVVESVVANLSPFLI
jgi:hypothetical protein